MRPNLPSREACRSCRARSPDTLPFERFDIFQPIQDPSTNFHIFRPFPEPSPSFKGSRTQCPAASQVDLIQVTQTSAAGKIVVDIPMSKFVRGGIEDI